MIRLIASKRNRVRPILNIDSRVPKSVTLTWLADGRRQAQNFNTYEEALSFSGRLESPAVNITRNY